MPKKLSHLEEAEQLQRFRQKVKELIAAGELNPTEADAALDNLVRRSVGK